jgi:2-oxo-4-hydroxy-4-carboxy-5-ureidoimidazoline decarboxylase
MIIDASERLTEALTLCLAVPRWVDDLVALAPFPSIDALLDAAQTVPPLSHEEFDLAMQTHPRIGESAPDPKADPFSHGEQDLVDMTDDSIVASIDAGNREYEAKFGRVFLISSTGRTPEFILGRLRDRMELDDAADLAIAQSELLDITLRRIAALEASGSL